MSANSSSYSFTGTGGEGKAKGRHRKKHSQRIEPYAWLGAGALTLGVGAAALSLGSGVAHADTGSSESRSTKPTGARDDSNSSQAGPDSDSAGTSSNAGSDDDQSEASSRVRGSAQSTPSTSRRSGEAGLRDPKESVSEDESVPHKWSRAPRTISLKISTAATVEAGDQPDPSTSIADNRAQTAAVSAGSSPQVNATSGDSNYGTFATTSLGGTPTNVAISANGDRAFVVVNGRVKIVEIGASAPTVGPDIAVGSDPNTIASSADGTRAYVTNRGSDTVSIIQTLPSGAAPRVTPVAVGSNPTGIAVNASGSRAFVANTGSGTVTIIDLGSSLPLSIPNPKTVTAVVGANPNSIAVNAAGTVAFVTNSGGDTVSIIKYDGRGTPKVINVSVSPSPTSVKINDAGTKAVVYSRGGIVSIIDSPAASTPTATTVPGVHSSYSDYPGFVAISSDGTRAFVTEHSSGRVSIIDTANPGAVPTYASFSDYPHSVVALRTGALAFTVAHNALFVVDAETGQAAPVLIPADNDSSQFQRVAINANGSRIIAVDNVGNLTAFYYTSDGGTTSDPINESIRLWISSLGTVFSDAGFMTKDQALKRLFGTVGNALSVGTILDSLGRGKPGQALYDTVQLVAGVLEWSARVPLVGPALGLAGLFLDTVSYAVWNTVNSPPADWATIGKYVVTHPAGAAAGALNGVIGMVANTASHFIPEVVVKSRANRIMELNTKVGDAIDKGVHNVAKGIGNGIKNIANGRWPWDNG